jgi:hypothetical protein
MTDPQPSNNGSKRAVWVILALVVVVGAGAAAVVLANRNDSGVTNGQAESISTTSSAVDNTTADTNRSSTSASATTAATSAASIAPATTVKVLTTKPPTPKPTVAPSLAVTSVSANYKTYPCSTKPQMTISWATTLADSVTIGIDNPGAFEQNLPPSGSLDVPFSACPGGKVTYYVIAKKSNGDQITRTIVVTAGT